MNTKFTQTVLLIIVSFALQQTSFSRNVLEDEFYFETNKNDHFRIKGLVGNLTNASTWESSTDSISWQTATILPDTNARSVVIENGKILESSQLAFPFKSKAVWENGSTLKFVGTIARNPDLFLFDEHGGAVNAPQYIEKGSYYNVIWDCDNMPFRLCLSRKDVVYRNKLSLVKFPNYNITVSEVGTPISEPLADGVPALIVDSFELKSGYIFMTNSEYVWPANSGNLIINKYAYFNGRIVTDMNSAMYSRFEFGGDLVIDTSGYIQLIEAADVVFSKNGRQNLTMRNSFISGSPPYYNHDDSPWISTNLSSTEGSIIVLKSTADLKNFKNLNIKGAIELGNYDLYTRPTIDYKENLVLTNGTGRLNVEIPKDGYALFNVSTGETYGMHNPLAIYNYAEKDTFKVRVEPEFGNLPINDKSSAINRTWHIDKNKSVGSKTTLGFLYHSSHMNPNYSNDTAFQVGHYVNGSWETFVFKPTPFDIYPNTYYGILENVTSFSPFALGNRNAFNNALPLRFVSSNAYLVNNTVRIEWLTAEERNISYFEIERSFNNMDFVSVGKVSAKNRVGLAKYELSDNNSVSSYYRVKVVNTDGSISFSRLMYVSVNSGNDFSVLPNPVNNILTFAYKNVSESGNIVISDLNGRVVKQITLSTNSSGITVDVSSLASGTYNAVFTTGKNYYIKRFVKI